MIRSFLNKNWKILTLFSLLFGLGGWLLWSYAVWHSAPQYELELIFNKYGEGPLEQVLFPSVTIFIGITLYTFIKKSRK